MRTMAPPSPVQTQRSANLGDEFLEARCLNMYKTEPEETSRVEAMRSM